MIKIENVVTPSPEQWKATIMGARNPLNSWDRYDSGQGCSVDFVDRTCDKCDRFDNEYKYGLCVNRVKKFIIGPNDYGLLKRLCEAGTDHRKFMRMIPVIATITAPLYWWKEFDTYKVSTVTNSCSTMHKIAEKEFTLEDFSTEHLYSDELEFFKEIIEMLNGCRNLYLQSKNRGSARIQKNDWWQMIQLLPSSYNQKRTVMLNYEVLANIYKSRRNHKLDEWAEHKEFTCPVERCAVNNNPDELYICDDCSVGKGFCDWIKTLPYSELITGKESYEDSN